QFHPNELFLLYNPQTNSGKQTKAMAKDIFSHINEIDAIHEKLIPTYWKEVITMLASISLIWLQMSLAMAFVCFPLLVCGL
ncbi:MAG: hypothetical protein O9262_09885, partial [Cyclobacteriaceae bacterium]|nr:hypothetical protein [Cyclobacteriaceae bacterium]